MRISSRDRVERTQGEGTPECFILEDWETGSDPGPVMSGCESTIEDGTVRINLFMAIEQLSAADRLRLLHHFSQ